MVAAGLSRDDPGRREQGELLNRLVVGGWWFVAVPVNHQLLATNHQPIYRAPDPTSLRSPPDGNASSSRTPGSDTWDPTRRSSRPATPLYRGPRTGRNTQ